MTSKCKNFKATIYMYRIMCILCTPQPIYWSTYRPTLDQYIGRHIGQVSVDMSTDISVESRSICQLRCVGRHIDRHIGRALVDVSTDTQPICWPICQPRVISDCRPTCRSIGYRHSANIQLPLELYLTFSDLNNNYSPTLTAKAGTRESL